MPKRRSEELELDPTSKHDPWHETKSRSGRVVKPKVGARCPDSPYDLMPMLLCIPHNFTQFSPILTIYSTPYAFRYSTMALSRSLMTQFPEVMPMICRFIPLPRSQSTRKMSFLKAVKALTAPLARVRVVDQPYHVQILVDPLGGSLLALLALPQALPLVLYMVEVVFSSKLRWKFSVLSGA